jgi:hypothetical protein
MPANSTVPVPTLPQCAGWIWLIMGSFGAASMIFGIVLAFFMASEARAVLIAITTAVFLFSGCIAWIGLRTVRGRAKDIMGNGFGSIVIGLMSVFEETQKMLSGSSPEVLIPGLIFILAGVLALIGRTNYLAWRNTRLTPGT